MIERFWAVLRLPSTRFESRAAAEQAAMLSALGHGLEFAVMECVSVVRKKPAEVEVIEVEREEPAPLLSQAERRALIGPDSLTARAGDGALAEEDAARAAPHILPEPLVSAEERRALLPADGPADPTDPIATCKAGWGSEHCPYPVGSKERKTWMAAFIGAMTSHPIETTAEESIAP